MNKIIFSTLTMILLLAAVSSRAQHPAVKDFYTQFDGNSDVHHIELDGDIFKLFTWIASFDENDQDAQAVGRIAGNLEGLDIVVVPKHLKASYTFSDVIKAVKKDRYDELMNVREDNSTISFYALGKDKEVRDMIIFIDEDSEFSIISLKGILNLDDLKYLADHHEDLK